jgi:peptide/nickel transport system substrate-binding protein
MRHPSRSLAWRPEFRRMFSAVLVSSLALGLAACNSAGETQAGPQEGGTLRVVVPGLPSNLDPQRISAAFDANVSRLINRTLTTTKAEGGKASGDLVPDLATDLGRASENNTIWEFKLRDGLKWADGSPITCLQLKYGAERNFATFADGLPYARSYLKDNETPYQGPFIGGNAQGLQSVTCTDAKTIKYVLKHPVGDFNYAVALPVFAPVKEGADSDDEQFNLTPLGNGPYKIKSRGEADLVLVRNEHWSAAVDKTRKAFPDEIVIKADNNIPAITNSLIEDQGEWKDTIMISSDVAPNFVQQVMNDPELLKRTVTGPAGLVRFFAINTKRNPYEKCRQALVQAFNKRKFRQAMGGSLLGDFATSVIPPSNRAYLEFDIYGTFLNGGEGDIDGAKKLLEAAEAAGETCSKDIVVAHADIPATNNRYMKTLVEMYLELGIRVTFKPVRPADYFATVSNISQHDKVDMIYAGWIPDWANGSSVIPALFKSSEVGTKDRPQGGSNYSYLMDPEIDRLIDEAMLQNNIERQYKLWGELDKTLQAKGVTIPIIYGDAIRLYGSNVGGAFIHSAFGMPDLSSLGLLSPGGSPS